VNLPAPVTGVNAQRFDIPRIFRLSCGNGRADMIRSMTGFGRAQVSTERVTIAVEVRSVNHRHLDVALKLPRPLSMLEPQARRAIQSRVERGRVDASVSVTPLPGEPSQRVALDMPLAHAYLEARRRLAGDPDLPLAQALEWVLDRPGVLRLEEPEPLDEATAWPLVEEGLRRALAELIDRREAEGDALGAALGDLHEALRGEVERMAARAPHALARRQERFRERLTALLGPHPIDEARVLMEVAAYAERTDIEEELTRLATHLHQLALRLKEGGPVGRPLDFLIQEMNREVNTIASKADDLELSQSTLAAKGILEKMREQVQNLE
jgi:uncharacterized protein (TIGR00255 family)